MKIVCHHQMRHPESLGEAEIVAWITYLATARRLARLTQMQALSAVEFLYRVARKR